MFTAVDPFAVSADALYRRVNRELAYCNKKLRKKRGNAWKHPLGRYYVLDVNRNAVVSRHVDLESFARERGVLQSHEALAPQRWQPWMAA